MYEVTLVATKASQDDSSVSSYVGVHSDKSLNIIDIPLTQLLNQYVPQELDSTAYNFDIGVAIKKWQLFLQPLVNREIPNNKVHNQSYFTALENFLIGQLVARELIINGYNQYLASLNHHVQEKVKNDGNAQELKSVETGPAKAEWYSSAEIWKDILRDGGPLHLLTNATCELAHRLRIILHFCGQPAQKIFYPRVYKVPKPKPTNPFIKTRI